MYFPISLLNFNSCFLPFFQAIKLLPIAVTMFGNYGDQRNVAKDASTCHIYNIQYLCTISTVPGPQHGAAAVAGAALRGGLHARHPEDHHPPRPRALPRRGHAQTGGKIKIFNAP